jgi:hypothetical protein
MTASKKKRDRVDVVIDLYTSGKIPSYTTAVNIVLRLIDKTKRKDQIANTDKEFAKLISKYSPTDSLKKVSITMILYREKESDKDEKQRDKQSTETPVNIDFPKGTTVADAHEEQELLRQIGDTFPAKMKYNLKQFSYLQFYSLKYS